MDNNFYYFIIDLDQVVEAAITKAKDALTKAEQDAEERGLMVSRLGDDANTEESEQKDAKRKKEASMMNMTSHLHTCHLKVQELQGSVEVIIKTYSYITQTNH